MTMRLFSLLLLVAGAISTRAQTTHSAPLTPVPDDAFVSATVESLRSLIEEKYFDQSAIPRINSALGTALARGEFAREKSLGDFAERLTSTLYQASHDKHLVVSVSAPSTTRSDQEPMSRAEGARFSNYGVKTARVLDGNVGYLEVTAFYRANEGSEAVDAAMRLLANTDAIILDLRINGGGSPDTALQLLSYFFADPEMPLFSIVPRSGTPTVERTQAKGIAYRDEKRPVYILVSAQTWSAGEGVSFILQERHRAKVIGENTPGAANPAEPSTINQALSVNIPFGSIKSSIKGTNWEGNGIVPDVQVDSEKAFQVAYVQALEELLSKTASDARRSLTTSALANARK